MIRAVLDTNVLLSALLSQRGASFEILQRLRRGEWQLVLSNHLLLEYEEVLKRNSDLIGIDHLDIDLLLNAICQVAEGYELPPVRAPRLPDLDDEPLLRLAEKSGARLIATGNLRHLAPASLYGVVVLLPRDFLHILRNQP